MTARNVPAAATSCSSLQGPITANLTDDRHSDGLDIQLINVDESDLEDSRKEDNEEGEATECDETDDAELGKSPIMIFDLIDLSDLSMTVKGVGCTDLCVLQTCPNNQIC